MTSKGVHKELLMLLRMINDTFHADGLGGNIEICVRGEDLWCSPSGSAYAPLSRALSQLAHRIISDWDDLDGW